MNRNELVVDQMHRAFSASPWHGPSLLEVLEGVTPEIAAARPMANTHSIWELVLHLITWKDTVRKRLDSKTAIVVADDDNFPKPPVATSDNWANTCEKLQRSHDQLVEAVRALTAERLEETVPGKDYSKLIMLLGIPQHDDYHAGQIALLKKAAR